MNGIRNFFDSGDNVISWNDRVFSLCMFFVAFLMPLSIRFTTYFIVASFFAATFSGRMFGSLKNLRNEKLNVTFILWFFLHLAGLLYSENLNYGFADIETKLSFLAFPLIFLGSDLYEKFRNNLLLAFVAGCILACIICLVKAIGWYRYDHHLGHFLYTSYSFFTHPTYFTLYLNMAILILLFHADLNWKSLKAPYKIMVIMSLVFIMINLTLLNARTATAAAYVTILACLLYIFIRSRNFLTGSLVILFTCFVFGFLQFEVLHINKGRMEQISHILEKDEIHKDYNSTTLRKELWKNAFQLILENPFFGVGTGDIKEELYRTYARNHFNLGIERNYSPHNQYLHSAVILGLIGMLILVGLLVAQLVIGFKRKYWLYVMFSVIVMINCITEDILEVEKGIIFFAFFSSLFYTDPGWKKAKSAFY